MKTVVRVVAVFGVVALLIAGGYWLYQQRSSAQATTDTSTYNQVVAVRQGDLDASISVVGELYAPQNEAMRFQQVDGATSLASLNVTAGEVVTAGQTLAAIDPSFYQQALDQALSDLQAAQQKLVDLQTPPTDLEIAQADLKVAQQEFALQQAQDALDDLKDPDIASLKTKVSDAQLALAQAQSSLILAQPDKNAQDRLSALRDRESDLYSEYSRLANETYSDTYYQDRLRLANNAFLAAQDTRISTETQQQVTLLRAQMQVRQAQQQLADAQEALDDALAGGDTLDMAAAEQAVAQAQADLADAKDARSALDEGADAVDLAAAQADVDKKQLAVSEAEADLAAATLVAPFAGTILETNAEAGDQITANSPILTIANLSELQVIASVDETTIRQVAQGQAAQITFDAYPGQSFSGQVLSVPLQGSLQGGVMVYEVPISLEGAENLPLLVGMTANVEIKTGEVQDALLVPTMALQTVNGLYQVLVPSTEAEGEPVSAPVEVGLSNGTYTQITRGLNLGDEVVVQLSSSDSSNDFPAFGFGGFDGGGPPAGAPPAGGPPGGN